MRSLVAVTIALFVASSAQATDKATEAEVADFWAAVFAGVPPLNASIGPPRTVGQTTVRTVYFDSYKDPDTTSPVRIQGFYALPNNMTGPGPGGTFPGFISTHSVGVAPPAEGEATAVYFAQKGYAALTFYVRGYGGSTMSQLSASSGGCANFLCARLGTDSDTPLNSPWAGMAVDVYQAAEFLAAQPEVWQPNNLAFTGHSLGGFATVMAGVFNPRIKVVAISAPAASGPSSTLDGWMTYWTPKPSGWETWAAGPGATLYGNSTTAMQMLTRMWSYTGGYNALNNAALVAKNPAWKLDNAEVFIYGGQVDPAVPPSDVEAAYLKMDSSNNKAFHWSPTGAHGGPESWNRTEAWMAGHYPGRAQTPPNASLSVQSTDAGVVTFSSAGTTDDALIVAWDYNFGDGTTRNWGPTVTHPYRDAGTYTATVTVTDGAGLRDSATVVVTIGTGSNSPGLVTQAADPVRVPEGGRGSFRVSLGRQPSSPVTITIARTSGDADLSIVGATTHTIQPADWNAPLTIEIAGAEDADRSSDSAAFSITSPGVVTSTVNAAERDNDARFTLSVGSASMAPGGTVNVPVTMTNEDAAFVDALGFKVTFDGTQLSATLTRAASVPGPAWWNTQVVNDTGAVSFSGQEFASFDGPLVQGEVASLSFTANASATGGNYALTVTDVTVNSAAASSAQGGTLAVTTEPAIDGGAGGGNAEQPGGAAPQPASGCGCTTGTELSLALAAMTWAVWRRRRPRPSRPTSA